MSQYVLEQRRTIGDPETGYVVSTERIDDLDRDGHPRQDGSLVQRRMDVRVTTGGITFRIREQDRHPHPSDEFRECTITLGPKHYLDLLQMMAPREESKG